MCVFGERELWGRRSSLKCCASCTRTPPCVGVSACVCSVALWGGSSEGWALPGSPPSTGRAWSQGAGCPGLSFLCPSALLRLWAWSHGSAQRRKKLQCLSHTRGLPRAWWSRVCLHALRVHFVFLERGLLSRAAVCSAVVKSGFATPGRPASPKVKASGGNSGAGDRQRDTAVSEGLGSAFQQLEWSPAHLSVAG